MAEGILDGTRILETMYGGVEIERWDAPVTGEQIRERALRLRRPVILRGVIEHWPALSRWNLEFFAEHLGGLFTNTFTSGDEAQSRQLRFRRLIARIQAGEQIYSSFYARDALAILRPDYPLDGTPFGDPGLNWLLELPKPAHGEMNVIFVGNQGSGIANHTDSMGTHLWSAQIFGRKRWWVSPPEMTPLLAEGPPSWRHRDRDVERYPRFANARCLDFVLEPGEVLILPAGWWHETEMVSDSVSITHDIVNDTNYRAYEHELEATHTVDPKVARLRVDSLPRYDTWRARLRSRASRSIERISGPIEFERLLEDYLIPRQPVILEGQIDDWQALSAWDMASFRSRFGQLFIQAFERYDDRNKRIRLRRFLDEQRDRPRYAMWCLDDCINLMRDDFARMPFLDTSDKDWTLELPPVDQKALTWIFLGLAGSGIACHSDRLGQHVASAQIHGRKRWWLHPPGDGPYLYRGEVDLAAPDLRIHPLYENASPVRECTLEPGEVLILPDGWWHQTRALSDSISLSHDFCNLSNAEEFITRLEARKGADYLEGDDIRPVIARWRDRLEGAR